MQFIERLVASLPRSVKALVGAFIAALILVPMGWQLYTQRSQVGPYLTHVNLERLLVALFLAVLDLGILVFAWLLIVNRLGIALGFAQDLRAFFFSNFVKRVPGMLWYVLGRAYMYRTDEGGAWIATTATVLENAFLFLTGVLLALSLWPQYMDLHNVWMFVAVFIVSLIVVVVSLHPTAMLRFAQLFQRGESSDQIRPLRLRATDMLLWILLYGLVWVIGGFSFHYFVSAFYPSLSFAAMPQTIGVSTVYSLTGFVAFFVPAGMGVKELAGSYLLSRVLPLPLAIVIVLLFRLHLLIAEGVWLALSHSLGLTSVPKGT